MNFPTVGNSGVPRRDGLLVGKPILHNTLLTKSSPRYPSRAETLVRYVRYSPWEQIKGAPKSLVIKVIF